jgi:hypothetical protein
MFQSSLQHRWPKNAPACIDLAVNYLPLPKRSTLAEGTVGIKSPRSKLANFKEQTFPTEQEPNMFDLNLAPTRHGVRFLNPKSQVKGHAVESMARRLCPLSVCLD